jgi:hypothetical protein
MNRVSIDAEPVGGSRLDLATLNIRLFDESFFDTRHHSMKYLTGVIVRQLTLNQQVNHSVKRIDCRQLVHV